MLCFQTKSLESANLFCDIPGEKLLLRESILNMKLKNDLLEYVLYSEVYTIQNVQYLQHQILLVLYIL